MTSAIALRAARVSRGGTPVVHDVDLLVGGGTWFGLIGANGSGKTSLLRAIAGRLPLDAGSCRIGDRELSGDRADRAETVGFAPPADRLPDAIRGRDLLQLAAGNVALGLRRLGPVRDALNVDDLLDRWLGDCSAGMRQRLAIALAFAGGKRIVILDEPFNWLDPVAVFDLRVALRSLVDEGLTLVTALHDLLTLAASCDAGAMLTDGRVSLDLDRETIEAARQDPGAFERRTIDLLRGDVPAAR